jgi:hypothetical protein
LGQQPRRVAACCISRAPLQVPRPAPLRCPRATSISTPTQLRERSGRWRAYGLDGYSRGMGRAHDRTNLSYPGRIVRRFAMGLRAGFAYPEPSGSRHGNLGIREWRGRQRRLRFQFSTAGRQWRRGVSDARERRRHRRGTGSTTAAPPSCAEAQVLPMTSSRIGPLGPAACACSAPRSRRERP